MAGGVEVRTEIDSTLEALGGAGEEILIKLMPQMARQIPNTIRYDVFPRALDRAFDLAGDAFPSAYREHLRVAFYGLPIEAYATAGEFVIQIPELHDALGTYADLSLGFHHNALLKINSPKFVRYPPKVQLPYGGQELESSDETRKEFWEQVIVGGDTWPTGVGSGTRGSFGGDEFGGPSFDEVAAARVAEAWEPIGKAPEWLILQYGTADAEPQFEGFDFEHMLRTAIECFIENYSARIIRDAKELAETNARLTAASGRRGFQQRSISTGRYTVHALDIDTSVHDSDICWDV